MPGGCYVYAIVEREALLPDGLTGLDGAGLFTVPSGELAAVASYLERGDLQPTAEHVLRHEAVVEGIREVSPGLPVRFGTILADADSVARALADRAAVLAADLARLGDKVEIGLSVLWDPPAEEEDADRAGAVVEGGAEGPGARYLRARLAQHRRDSAIRDRASALARDLDGVLAPWTLDRRSTILPTRRLAVRAAYLLQLSRVDGFRAVVDDMRRTRRDLRFLLSGPWPPYSFVTPTNPGEHSATAGLLSEVAP